MQHTAQPGVVAVVSARARVATSRKPSARTLMQPPDPLLTMDEVAARLRTSERFVRRLVAERRIAFTKVGKYVRVSASDVDAFLASGRIERADAKSANRRAGQAAG